ncbi:MAG: hypothetical protein GY860_14185 [Desulfobacteraceae bacterium]|nr:hypothetical protein [Desulfobacteraceae bacterium]
MKKLGHRFDEIKLLVFESQFPDVLSEKEEIDELYHLSKEFNLTYNINLPTNVSLTDPAGGKRALAIATVKRVMELCQVLNPTTHTLHLDYHGDHDPGESGVKRWRDRVFESLEKLIESGVDAKSISIETL